jgi:hypothetical protein
MNRQYNGKKSLKIPEGKSEEIYRIRRYHGHNNERTKGQTTIYNTLHRKLKI